MAVTRPHSLKLYLQSVNALTGRATNVSGGLCCVYRAKKTAFVQETVGCNDDHIVHLLYFGPIDMRVCNN